MQHVLTLIAPAGKRNLGDAAIAHAVSCAQASGCWILDIQWLASSEAADVRLEGVDAQAEWVHRLADDLQCDAVLQVNTSHRRKKLLISDMDSTIITIECIDELADEVGIKPQVAKITERAMNGELDFAQALTERVALLAGLEEAALQRVYEKRVQFMSGARELVATMRASGAQCVLVSGGFTYFTGRVKDELGFHADFSNRLEMANGKLTGRVIPPILGKEAKLETLHNTCKAMGILPEAVLAIGDGANDLPMILAAGMGIAYHAKPSVRKAAQASITHADLRGALFVQGYTAKEIMDSFER